ncbi:CmpA/NrtA family ABC transporter substrate-binding protein [Opitutus sp. GAS368]|jgi:ABC-type nitrate/sulfonate/bicarbonate transport system substrate-binding protein|uniref:CmpA/NrtA family ABC transporter substrate-binding protein n=1 Tax=Opitutus sp. GAS368 TaxID=1882749 RepID=UPI00087A901D|nr:CmpA/NrtA family ABC transporter substrate-binding protein [Opitutus sp. GAS368]SDR66063.1 NitT/TauT family transport system ATP-binding protein [Opitutus sp. GAS368]
MPATVQSQIADRHALRLGFLALTDAAPLVAAQELGLFAHHGLRIQLCREVGWATIRDKVIYGELDAAHAPAPMLWAAQLGLDCAPADVCTGLVLNLHGNAITLSNRLWAAGVRDTGTLREVALGRRGESKLTFGVVFPFSTHHLQLRQWLQAAGLDPERDVRIAVVPPAQMFRNLAAGTLDGYCAGEPWNTLAVQQNEGWCPAWSAQLSPGHVEKVLMVRATFAKQRAPEHAALIAALASAAAWCDEPRHRLQLADMLASPHHLNLPAKVIAPALLGRFATGHGRVESAPDFHVFSRGDASAPTPARAAALQSELVAAGLVPRGSASVSLPRRLFREDLYREATVNLDYHAHIHTKLHGGALVSA